MIRQLTAIVLLAVFTAAAYMVSSTRLEPTYDEWSRISVRPLVQTIDDFSITSERLIRAQVFTEAFRDTVPASSSIVIADMNSPLTIGYAAQKPLVSASLYKLFTALYVYKAVDAGELELTDKTPAGRIDECLDVMITLSDNDCAVELSELIGWERLDTMIKTDGYANTYLNNYDADGKLSGDKFTSAADVAVLLKHLYDRDVLSDTSNNQFLSLLSQQLVDDRQPDVVPEGVEFWHKTGNLFETAHDAGFIVKEKQVFLYVIMTDEWQENAFFESQQYYKPFFEGLIDIFDL